MRCIWLVAIAVCAGLSFGAGIDAFENADFEDGKGYGRLNKFTVVGRGYGWNMGGGARMSGFQREVFVLPVKKSLRLKKGERYLFTMMTRCNTKAACCQIALETWNPDTGAYEGYWGRKVFDIGGGWNREELSFVPRRDLDASKEKLNFILQVAIDPHVGVTCDAARDYIDFDNATLSSEEPLWLFCNTWPTHNWIFNEKGLVRAHSSFVGEFLKEGARPEYVFSLLKPDGSELARTTAREKNGVLGVEFGRIAYEGPAVLSATLRDRGRTLATKTREVEVRPTYRPKKGEVFINIHGQAIVDGRPFMPLGFYSKLADPSLYTPEQLERELKRLHDAGFNYLVDYASYMLKSKESRDRYYGLCEKYGIRVLVDDFSGYMQTPDKIGEIGPLAKELAQYPAIIGWYTMDEASEDKIPVLEKIRRELNRATPGHIVLTCNIVAPEPFLPTADVQSGDQYPINAESDAFLRAENYLIRAAACRPAAAWHAPQSFNGVNYDPAVRTDRDAYLKKGREPTENEMLSVALSFVANGISGFAFYSHFDLTRGPVPELYEKRWRDIAAVGKTLREIEKFVVGARRAVDLPHKDVRGRTRILAKYADDGSVVVLAYGLKADNKATFSLPREMRGLVPSYGFVKKSGDGYVFEGKDLTCDILK